MTAETRLAAQLAARAVTPPTAPTAPTAHRPPHPDPTGDSADLGFADLVDAVNPLQQLPVVSSVYREATGDTISIPARLAGAFLFGGLPGLVGSAAMVAFEEVTGDTVLGHIGSLIDGGDGGTAVASGAPPGSMPWLNGGSGGEAGPSLPSPQALAEALRRRSTAMEMEMATAPSTVPVGERPPPQVLAKLYSLEATSNSGTPGVVRKEA